MNGSTMSEVSGSGRVDDSLRKQVQTHRLAVDLLGTVTCSCRNSPLTSQFSPDLVERAGTPFTYEEQTSGYMYFVVTSS